MVQKCMDEEVAQSLFSSLAVDARVDLLSPDFLTVIHFLLAFHLISAVAMTLMQRSSVVSVRHTAINVQSVSLSLVSSRY